jgi:hypothetical protein
LRTLFLGCAIALLWTTPLAAQEAADEPAPADPAPAQPEPATAPEPVERTEPEPELPAEDPVIVPRDRLIVVREDNDEEEEEENEEDVYDFLYIELFGGASYVDLRAIETSNYYPEFVRLSGYGPAGGAAVGFRVSFFSAGVRVALARYDAGDSSTSDAVFDVGTAAGEVTLALPLSVVRPFLRIGFGFGWHGDSNFQAPEMSQTTVFGWVFQAAVGIDFFVADWFSIGVAFNADILNMSRQSFDEPVTDPGMVRFEDNGDAVGAQGRAHLAATFRF